MLRHLVSDQDMDRPTWRIGDAVGNDPVMRRGNVRAAGSGVIGGTERLDEVGQPMRVGPGVIVNVGDDLARGFFQPRVAGAAEPTIFRPDDATRELSRNAARSVGGASSMTITS